MDNYEIEALLYYMRLKNLGISCGLELTGNRIDDPIVWIYDFDMSSHRFSAQDSAQSRIELDKILMEAE